jgi:hypothetical protein
MYDIETTANSYTVTLKGRVLKYSGPIQAIVGNVGADEALLVMAVSSIENLTGMAEE